MSGPSAIIHPISEPTASENKMDKVESEVCTLFEHLNEKLTIYNLELVHGGSFDSPGHRPR